MTHLCIQRIKQYILQMYSSFKSSVLYETASGMENEREGGVEWGGGWSGMGVGVGVGVGVGAGCSGQYSPSSTYP